MASSPFALVARVVDAFRSELVSTPPPQPPALPGYRAPEPLAAGDYLAPQARWPLLWLCDIGGWRMDPVTQQVSFTLTHGARYRNEAAEFQCKMPFADGDLFDKRGAYVLIAVPAENEARMNAILSAVSKLP